VSGWFLTKDLEIKVTLLQIGGREEETIKPAEFIHDLIMRNINEDYRLEKQREREEQQNQDQK
jgi:hypothetical protein